MTTIRRTIRRETSACQFSGGEHRPIILTIEPPGRVLRLRLKGERRTVTISVAAVYALACQAERKADSRPGRRLSRRPAKNAG